MTEDDNKFNHPKRRKSEYLEGTYEGYIKSNERFSNDPYDREIRKIRLDLKAINNKLITLNEDVNYVKDVAQIKTLRGKNIDLKLKSQDLKNQYLEIKSDYTDPAFIDDIEKISLNINTMYESNNSNLINKFMDYVEQKNEENKNVRDDLEASKSEVIKILNKQKNIASDINETKEEISKSQSRYITIVALLVSLVSIVFSNILQINSESVNVQVIIISNLSILSAIDFLFILVKTILFKKNIKRIEAKESKWQRIKNVIPDILMWLAFIGMISGIIVLACQL